MAYRVNRTVIWQAGPSTPIKYSFTIDANLSVESFINQIATVSLVGSVSISNYPLNSRNSFAASDFAVLSPGDVDVATHPFVYGTSYYQQAIPFLPDPQNGDVNKILIQFRGDTWISDSVNNNNKSSLYIKGQGVVVNQIDQETTSTFPISLTYDVPIAASGNTPVLEWITSGADNSTTYDWMDKQVWVSWFDLDYRPGAVLDTVWKSHNRSGGKCHVFDNSKYLEMRTVGAPTAMGNPPSIYHDNKWYNGARLGKES